MARKFDSSDLHLYLYDLAFLQQDESGMQRQTAWAAGEPGFGDLFLGHTADTLAFVGQDAKAREFTDHATAAGLRSSQRGTAAGYQVSGTQREALFGNPAEARRLAEAALALARDRDTKYGGAVALALAGATAKANVMADQLNKDFPDDTFVQFLYLPAIRGAVAREQKDSTRAIQALDPAAPYERGVASGFLSAYLRGLAYLQAGDGRRAQSEFEIILANPGVVLNSPIGPLSRLQLARAYTLQGKRAEATAAYQDFLARWKDADADLPILQAVKAEYAKQTPPSAP
jgi:predicted Zn-dependent protease